MSTEVSTSILQAAIAATSTDRPNTHGDAEVNFAAIAGLWNAYLRLVDGRTAADLSPLDVAQMMVLFKMARTMSGDPTCADHWVDQAGYTAVAARLAGARMASAAADIQRVLAAQEEVRAPVDKPLFTWPPEPAEIPFKRLSVAEPGPAPAAPATPADPMADELNR